MTLTPREKELIKDNLTAYLHNFEPITLVKADYGTGIYVYENRNPDYVQYCYNIDYLNGWLYGAVQAINNKLSKQ